MSLLIPGTNSIKDTGYDVANSARFDAGNTEYIQRTYGTPTNAKIFGLSWWIKMSGDPVSGTGQFDLWGERTDSSNRVFMGIDGVGQFDFFEKNGGSNVLELETTRKFRDQSAWYHFLLLGDSTQGTASDRIKLYVNGVQETSFVTETYPSQDYEFRLALNTTKYFGRIGLGSQLSTNYFDGYLAEVAFVDGTVTSHTDYGEFDSDTPNVWKPKDISGLTFGNNGFHLDFEDSSSLGNDAAGSNNFTVNNLTSIDQTTDTCTNNFAVMGNLHPLGANLVLKDGNLTVSSSGSTDTGLYKQSIMPTSGKWYFEIKLISASSVSDNTRMGVANFESVTGTDTIMGDYTGFELSTASADKLFFTDNGSTTENSTFYTALSDNDIVRFALDMDNSKLYVGVNANWWNYSSSETGGDPTSGSGYVTDDASWENAMFNGSPLTAYYGQNGGPQTGEVQFNFGNPPFSITSGNSDGNGYGNFEFAVPSGYYSINTKNLAEFG